MLKLKNTKTEVKKSLSGLKNRINRTEERITESEARKTEITQSGWRRLTENGPLPTTSFNAIRSQGSILPACSN